MPSVLQGHSFLLYFLSFYIFLIVGFLSISAEQANTVFLATVKVWYRKHRT
jgi:hypothetical protein